jgi:CheY-like chemotaxis protein
MAFISLRCFPIDDAPFARAAEALLKSRRARSPNARPDPAVLQRRLRVRYPRAVVAARELMARHRDDVEVLWYVYRDGSMTARPRLTRRVLVVDDDHAFSLMLDAMLSSAGYEVRRARDGADGLREVAQFAPDLILLDLSMPNADGEQFATNYRNVPPPRAQIVVVSGVPDAWQRAQGTDARAVVKKPFEMAPFLDLVRQLA